MATHKLDVPELHRRLDAQRQNLGLSWRGVARQVGLSISTFVRIGNGHSMEADALVSLLVWLDMDTDIAMLLEPGDAPVSCPTCRQTYMPKRDGTVRAHNCQAAA